MLVDDHHNNGKVVQPNFLGTQSEERHYFFT